MAGSREVTNKLLELLEDGILSYPIVVGACLSYMSEADVADMARVNEFIGEEEEEEEE